MLNALLSKTSLSQSAFLLFLVFPVELGPLSEGASRLPTVPEVCDCPSELGKAGERGHLC